MRMYSTFHELIFAGKFTVSSCVGQVRFVAAATGLPTAA